MDDKIRHILDTLSGAYKEQAAEGGLRISWEHACYVLREVAGLVNGGNVLTLDEIPEDDIIEFSWTDSSNEFGDVFEAVIHAEDNDYVTLLGAELTFIDADENEFAVTLQVDFDLHQALLPAQTDINALIRALHSALLELLNDCEMLKAPFKNDALCEEGWAAIKQYEAYANKKEA